MYEQNEQGERIIFSMRTHPKALVGPVIVALLVIAVAMAIAVFLPDRGWTVWARMIGWALCAIALLAWGAGPVLSWRSSVFTVTTHRVQVRSGFITRRGSDVLLSRITNIETERGLLDRIFGCGTLIIKDAGSAEGMALRDVPDAVRVRSVISDLSYEASSLEPGGQAGARD